MSRSRRSFLKELGIGAALFPMVLESGQRELAHIPRKPCERGVLLATGSRAVFVSGRQSPDERGQPLPVISSRCGPGRGAHSRRRPGLLLQQSREVRRVERALPPESRASARRESGRDRAGAQHQRGKQHRQQRNLSRRGRRDRPLGPEPPHEQRGVGRAGRPLRAHR